jgi:Butirosin biosynthesis protein H, N-terminal
MAMPNRDVPFVGRISYCLVRCFKMVLDARGDRYDLPFLECASSEPFGFTYVRGADGGFAVNGIPYHVAGERLLKLLGYAYELCADAPEDVALAWLADRVARGPVVAGMLDAGFLTYHPNHVHMRGADHAIVVLDVADAEVIVHDPNGFVATPLPLKDFLAAWRADGIYTGKARMAWVIGARQRRPADEELYHRALEWSLDNLRRAAAPARDGVAILFGPRALRALAQDIRADRIAPRWRQLYTHWSFRVSGQRCHDSALFIRAAPFGDARLAQVAELRLAEAVEYGRAQAALTGAGEAASALERLAGLEDEMTQALNAALGSVAPGAVAASSA